LSCVIKSLNDFSLFSCESSTLVESEFGDFVEREKQENPKKKFKQGKNQQQTQATCGTRLESNPGHRWLALSPLRHL